MSPEKIKFKTVDEYISQFPIEVQEKLEAMRMTIKKATPEAKEIISYNMPPYKMNRILVYFAGYEHHIGFYPGADGIEAFKKEILKYKNAKGSVQFPLDQPLPLALITKIIKFKAKRS